MPKHIALAVLLVLATTGAQAQNLVANSGFDNDLSVWIERSSSVVEAEWSSSDEANSALSGSALLSNTVAGGRWVLQTVCIDVDPAAFYLGGASFRVLPGQEYTGSGYFALGWYSDDNCENYVTNGFTDNVGVPGSWVTAETIFPAAGHESVVVHLAVTKNEEPGQLDLEVDNAFFIETRFADGFEGGDLSSWSSAMP